RQRKVDFLTIVSSILTVGDRSGSRMESRWLRVHQKSGASLSAACERCNDSGWRRAGRLSVTSFAALRKFYGRDAAPELRELARRRGGGRPFASLVPEHGG